jgi:hypothetical protein
MGEMFDLVSDLLVSGLANGDVPTAPAGGTLSTAGCVEIVLVADEGDGE